MRRFMQHLDDLAGLDMILSRSASASTPHALRAQAPRPSDVAVRGIPQGSAAGSVRATLSRLVSGTVDR